MGKVTTETQFPQMLNISLNLCTVPSQRGRKEHSGKSSRHRKDLLGQHRSIHGEKTCECPLCPYRTTRKDKLVSHQKVHTSDQTLNGKPKTQLLSEPKETQQPSNLKRKISHQYPVTSSTYSRQKNIIVPVDSEQFLNDIEKQENKDHAFIEF